jgi:hypothetical protein
MLKKQNNVPEVTVEDEFDFWKELSSDTPPTSDVREDCLLSKEPLGPNYVTFPCGHKFNYLVICAEMASLKYPKSRYSGSIKLGRNQIYCPYCRKIFNKLLPIIPIYSLDLPSTIFSKKNAICNRTCSFIHKKTSVPCILSGFESDHGVFCVKHYNKFNVTNITNKIIPSVIENNPDGNNPYDKCTLKELKELLRAAGKKVSGNKTILIERLQP